MKLTVLYFLVATMCYDTLAMGQSVVLDVFGASAVADNICSCSVEILSGSSLSVRSIGNMAPGYAGCGTQIQLVSSAESIGLDCTYPFGTVSTNAGETVNVTFRNIHTPYNSDYCLMLSPGKFLFQSNQSQIIIWRFAY